jgi:hypothetical protein
MSFLVTVVVTYVLIPGAQKEGLSPEIYFSVPVLMLHNANNTMMATELLLSNMKFSFWHFPFCILFGVCYVLFQWYWVEKVGAFYYFFLDYDRSDAPLWYIGLLIAVRISRAMFRGAFTRFDLQVTVFFFVGLWLEWYTSWGGHTSRTVSRILAIES